MPAELICKQTVQSNIDEINAKINRLMSDGYELVKMVGTGDQDSAQICILLKK